MRWRTSAQHLAIHPERDGGDANQPVVRITAKVDSLTRPHAVEERQLLHIITGAAVHVKDGQGPVRRERVVGGQDLCHPADALLDRTLAAVAVVVQAAEPDILVPAPEESYAT